MLKQGFPQEAIIEAFTVAIRLIELAGNVDIFTFRLYHRDGFEADKQHIIRKALFTRFIFPGRPFGNGFIDAGFRARAFGEAQGFAIGLPACFTQLRINQEAALFFAKVECALDGLIGNFFVVSLTFLFSLFGQFRVLLGELCFQRRKASLGLRFCFLLFAFQNSDIAVQGNQLLLLRFDFCLSLRFFSHLLFKLLF